MCLLLIWMKGGIYPGRNAWEKYHAPARLHVDAEPLLMQTVEVLIQWKYIPPEPSFDALNANHLNYKCAIKQS